MPRGSAGGTVMNSAATMTVSFAQFSTFLLARVLV